MFENPRKGRQARNFKTNVPKILDLKSSSEQIFSENWRWVPLMAVHEWSHLSGRSGDGFQGRDPFNHNFRKFRSKTQWIGSVQPEKFRKNGSTFWGGPLFPVRPVGILVEWIAPQDYQDNLGEFWLVNKAIEFLSSTNEPSWDTRYWL